MCIEREKVDFKSREVNCLKECALDLRSIPCIFLHLYFYVNISHHKNKNLFTSGLEPPTFRLTAERANRLCHGDLYIEHYKTNAMLEKW